MAESVACSTPPAKAAIRYFEVDTEESTRVAVAADFFCAVNRAKASESVAEIAWVLRPGEQNIPFRTTRSTSDSTPSVAQPSTHFIQFTLAG
jgi:hypothetical protein